MVSALQAHEVTLKKTHISRYCTSRYADNNGGLSCVCALRNAQASDQVMLIQPQSSPS